MSERFTGQVYNWSDRGYGFIFVTPLQRYFVHISEFKADHVPVIGEKVTFIPKPPRKTGPDVLPLATDVRPADQADGGAQ